MKEKYNIIVCLLIGLYIVFMDSFEPSITLKP